MTAEHHPGRSSWLQKAERWALPGVPLLAFALRVYRLGDKNIWWDEGFSFFVARKGLLDATLRTAQDVHPPLYYWSLWAWIRLVGESEFAARFLSAAWAVLTVAAVYALGARLGGRRVGLLAALFLALARFHIWWSQEMRMHILAPLVATLAFYGAVRWLDDERRRALGEPGVPSSPLALWLYVAGAAGCLYTLYLAGLAPLVANLYALVALARIPRARRLPVAVRWYAAQAAALALFVPWGLFALGKMSSWSVAEPFGFRLLLQLYGTLLSLGISTNVERYLICLLPFAAALAGGLVTLGWRRRAEPGVAGGQAALLLALAVASMPLAVYVMTRPRGFLYTPRVEARYMVLFVPAFCAFLAWSLVRLGRRLPVLGLAGLAGCLGVMLAFLPGYYEGRHLRDELQSMMRILATYVQPGDTILLISGDRYPIFDYYYERIVPPERRVPVLHLPQTAAFTAENVESQLAGATAGHSRFWVAAVEIAIQDPSGLSLPWLGAHFRRLYTYPEGRNALILYGDGTAGLAAERGDFHPQRRLAAQLGSLEILGYDMPVHECQAGDMVSLGLYWAGREAGHGAVQWLHEDGTVLQSAAQAWTATGPAADRAAVRFAVSPYYPAGCTHFAVRWIPDGGAARPAAIRLPGPRILAAPGAVGGGEAAQRLDTTFAGGIKLQGCSLHRPLAGGLAAARPGEELTLDLFWEAVGPVAENYTVFTHLVGSAQNPRTGGPVWAQHDGPPADGQYPSQTWMVGQIVRDRHVLAIDAQAPPGDYELEVGLYLPATGERLRVLRADGTAGDDRVVVARLRLK